MPTIQPINIEQLKDTLQEIREKGEKNADVSFARLFSKHGNGTPQAKEHARQYALKS